MSVSDQTLWHVFQLPVVVTRWDSVADVLQVCIQSKCLSLLKSVATNPRTTQNQQRFSFWSTENVYATFHPSLFLNLVSNFPCKYNYHSRSTYLLQTTDYRLCLSILAHVTEWQLDFHFSLQIKKPGWGLQKQNCCSFITFVEESTTRVLQGGNPLTSHPIREESRYNNSTNTPFFHLPHTWATAAADSAG